MSNTSSQYREELLHWIWEKQHFDFRQLVTNTGKPVQIIECGSPNRSDGPDFREAVITIGALRWYGDVEIHWRLSDWRSHEHHNDSNYNNVVLHLVFENSDRQSVRADGTEVPTLCLSPYISKPLQAFLNKYQSPKQLPCSGHFSFISEEAFREQLEKAHKEYFEQKVNDLLVFYDPSLLPSQAWTKMLAVALFNGLGIAHNRASMQQLGQALFDITPNIPNREQLRHEALKLSGFDKRHSATLDINWNHKGCRPGNHPRVRVLQASDVLWHLHSAPFEQWMHKNPEAIWKNLTNAVTTDPSIGRERASILYGTVFLPSLYSLGNLFFSDRLKNQSWTSWLQHRAYIPKSLLKLFRETDIPSSIYDHKLGAIHQLRSYCRPKNCRDCIVFKNAISS